MKYYVVGYADTRGEFSPYGVTKSAVKAEKYKINLAKRLFENSRQWATIREVDGI
jgi:hypothetical protein|tara:strand:+ start:478 stop:642 length:165 start_codon:yes stop_codon:yes gene_type:complete